MESFRGPAPRLTLTLTDCAGLEAAAIGGKSANLAKLAAAGFPVPPGFVIPPGSFERWTELGPALLASAQALGAARLAVRSSATAEDMAGASYAGQYDSFLDVGLEGLEDAVRRCWDSAASRRVAAYEAGRHPSAGAAPAGMAVLVQSLVAATAAGVAFTANPVTGARDEVVVTALRGLGERLVSGQATGEEWVIRSSQATCTRSSEPTLDSEQALAIASLARRIQAYLGSPQDVEWATAGGDLFVLQARPMTGLPESVDWKAPSPGQWMRNFRIGEWLPEPMTPLFRSWLLERLEGGYLKAMRKTIGTAIPFQHTAINGWYYTAPPRPSPVTLARALVESRGRVVGFITAVLIRINTKPELADRKVLQALTAQWRDQLVPGYRRLVAESASRVDTASPAELVQLIDEVGEIAGEYLFSLAVVGGSAWKMEGCLAKFVRRHLATAIEESVQVLFCGLRGAEPEGFAHDVQSLDWWRPTAGEMGWAASGGAHGDRHQQLATAREALEARCRGALQTRPRLLARFESLLEVSQRYGVIREQQSRLLTLGWPLLRTSVLRLGLSLAGRGVIDEPADVFFLLRAELGGGSSCQESVRRRRAAWERQRRLSAPLAIGRHAADGEADEWRRRRRPKQGSSASRLDGRPARQPWPRVGPRTGRSRPGGFPPVPKRGGPGCSADSARLDASV